MNYEQEIQEIENVVKSQLIPLNVPIVSLQSFKDLLALAKKMQEEHTEMFELLKEICETRRIDDEDTYIDYEGIKELIKKIEGENK